MPLILIVVLIVCCAPAAAQAPDGVTDRKGVVGDPLDLDPAFAGDGTLTVQIALHDYASKGFFEPSGEIVILGSSEAANASRREAILLRTGLEARDAAVAVLLSDGRMDPSYNGGAGKTFDFGGQPSGESAA